MTKPIIVYQKRSNDFTDEIVLTKAELQRIIDTAYDDGHKDGAASKPWNLNGGVSTTTAYTNPIDAMSGASDYARGINVRLK